MCIKACLLNDVPHAPKENEYGTQWKLDGNEIPKEIFIQLHKTLQLKLRHASRKLAIYASMVLESMKR